MPELNIGKKAPSFSFKDEDGKKISLSEIVGEKGLILYFYPKDMTPGCTTEACDFRDHSKEFQKIGFTIAGVSKDGQVSHEKFRQKYELPFRLIPDEDFSICNKYGVFRDKKFMGKTKKGIVRSTFILDKDLKILKIYDEVKVKDHILNIIKDTMEWIR